MILRARATKIFEQTDDAGTRDVRNMSVAVTLSSNGQRKSGIHIGMSMQRPTPPQTEARNKKLQRSLAGHHFANDYTTQTERGNFLPKPPCGASLHPHPRGCTDHHGSCTKFGRFEMSMRSKFVAPANTDTVVKRRRSTSDETKTNILGDEQISKVLIIRSASRNRLTWAGLGLFTKAPEAIRGKIKEPGIAKKKN